MKMGQTSDPETLVIHQKMTPGNNPEDFKPHATLLTLLSISIFVLVFPFVSESTDLRIYHVLFVPTVTPVLSHFNFCKNKPAPDMAGLSTGRPDFDTSPVHTRFVLDQVALGRVLQVSLSVSIDRCSLFIYH
jgi:hypothetical protein